MIVGVPREVKEDEQRVGVTPEMAATLVECGHQVLVEAGAGAAVGYLDATYLQVGAKIVPTAHEAYSADLIIKVKEPQPEEYALLRADQVLFCFLHLAANRELTEALQNQEVVAIAYETVTDHQGRLPLLMPMSELAGPIAVQAGATALHVSCGGRGILIGGVPGVPPAKVTIVGGGVVGAQAAKIALGLGADVTVVDKNISRLRQLQAWYGMRLKTCYSTATALFEQVTASDLVIGAVLIPGHRAPHVVTHAMVKQMARGAVIVDVAIDQGGCCETSRPTTHSQPTYLLDNVVHYCVTNMPGACARTGTEALAHAVMPYVLGLANKGWKQALASDAGFRNGLEVCQGSVTHAAVGESLGLPSVEAESFL